MEYLHHKKHSFCDESPTDCRFELVSFRKGDNDSQRRSRNSFACFLPQRAPPGFMYVIPC